MYLIKEASKISGVSVRTLHYYDEIGLLSPQKYKNGYRYYSEDDMDYLQMILFYNSSKMSPSSKQSVGGGYILDLQAVSISLASLKHLC